MKAPAGAEERDNHCEWWKPWRVPVMIWSATVSTIRFAWELFRDQQ
jgi:hypothetical protein